MNKIIFWKKSDGSVAREDCTHQSDTEFPAWLAYRQANPPKESDASPALMTFAGVIAKEDDIPAENEQHFNHHEWDEVAKKPVLNMAKVTAAKTS